MIICYNSLGQNRLTTSNVKLKCTCIIWMANEQVCLVPDCCLVLIGEQVSQVRFDWLVISIGSDVSSPVAVAEAIFHSRKVKLGVNCSVRFIFSI